MQYEPNRTFTLFTRPSSAKASYPIGRIQYENRAVNEDDSETNQNKFSQIGLMSGRTDSTTVKMKAVALQKVTLDLFCNFLFILK